MNCLHLYKYFPTGKMAIRKNFLGHIVLQEIQELHEINMFEDTPKPLGKFKQVDLTMERLLELKMNSNLRVIQL